MAVNILTIEDLNQFKSDLFSELAKTFKPGAGGPKKWLKSDEVREILKVSPGTLQTLRINGTLQYTKIGGIIYYDYEHIEKTMNGNLRPARSNS